MRKDVKRKLLHAFHDRIFTLETVFIIIASVLMGVVYVYLAKPSKVDMLSSVDTALIIAIFTASHTLFAWTVFPRLTIRLSKVNVYIHSSAAISCLIANLIGVFGRYLLVPFNTHSAFDTVYVGLSIMLTALLLTMPGWLYSAFRNQHHFVAALQNAGIAISEMPMSSASLDELQKLLPASKRGPLLLLKASGNYTEVLTTCGSYTLRIGIGEAERISTAQGLRVHKSYWIAKDEILRLVYTTGNPKLVTQSGNLIPVSRSMVPALRAIIEGIHH